MIAFSFEFVVDANIIAAVPVRGVLMPVRFAAVHQFIYLCRSLYCRSCTLESFGSAALWLYNAHQGSCLSIFVT